MYHYFLFMQNLLMSGLIEDSRILFSSEFNLLWFLVLVKVDVGNRLSQIRELKTQYLIWKIASYAGRSTNHHTSVCSGSTLCVHLLLSPRMLKRQVLKGWDLLKIMFLWFLIDVKSALFLIFHFFKQL